MRKSHANYEKGKHDNVVFDAKVVYRYIAKLSNESLVHKYGLNFMRF